MKLNLVAVPKLEEGDLTCQCEHGLAVHELVESFVTVHDEVFVSEQWECWGFFMAPSSLHWTPCVCFTFTEAAE